MGMPSGAVAGWRSGREGRQLFHLLKEELLPPFCRFCLTEGCQCSPLKAVCRMSLSNLCPFYFAASVCSVLRKQITSLLHYVESRNKFQGCWSLLLVIWSFALLTFGIVERTQVLESARPRFQGTLPLTWGFCQLLCMPIPITHSGNEITTG